MRKANQEITDKDALESILARSKICRLGISGEKGPPYVVPFNYGYKNGCIYIHCSPGGRKLELLESNPYVCFEIEQLTEVITNSNPCKWATLYRSIVGYANVEIIRDFRQKLHGLEILMKHNGALEPLSFDKKQVDAIYILKLTIDKMTGKQSSNWDSYFGKKDYELETERLQLREITYKDIEIIHKLHSTPEVDEFNTLGIPRSIDETIDLMEPCLNARYKTPRERYTWKVVLKDTDEFIGLAGIILSNDKFKLGEIYYKLNPDYWGKGYATEVARRLIKAGFDDLGLHKIEAGVAIDNMRSINVLSKAGMTNEGVRREMLPIRGRWVNSYHYTILEGDERDY